MHHIPNVPGLVSQEEKHFCVQPYEMSTSCTENRLRNLISSCCLENGPN
ncbi:unnamed protein product [Tenebrio molitor]|nr:unnamed protein product [Tenebrio molitor]